VPCPYCRKISQRRWTVWRVKWKQLLVA
jgi:hypothetical protein